MRFAHSPILGVLALLLFTSMSAAKASEPQEASGAHVCHASAPNHCKATEAYRNAVVLELAGSFELAAKYLKQVKELVDDPNDALYKKADSRLQALTENGMPRRTPEPTHDAASQAYNNAVVLERANSFEMAAEYFKKVKELIDDPNDALYKKADRKLQKLTDAG